MTRRSILAALVALLGCERRSPTTTQVTGAEHVTSSTSGPTDLDTTGETGTTSADPASTSGEATSDDSTTAVEPDLPHVEPPPPFCGKVDILYKFQYDGSSGAPFELDAPKVLVNGLLDRGFDIQFMAINGTELHGSCTQSCIEFGECGTYSDCDLPASECDLQRGTGIVLQSGGAHEQCFDNGQRFITPDMPFFEGTLECITKWAPHGGGLPMTAITLALGEHLDPGGCNEGFVRDDALLVVVSMALSDEKGDAALWREQLLDLKHGDEDAIVWLSMFDLGSGPLLCDFDTFDAWTLREFTSSLPHGMESDWCDVLGWPDDFERVLAEIDDICGTPDG